MIKCIYDQCRWPECDKTCGLVPSGDYVAGSCAEEKLIAHLQGRIEDLIDTFRVSQLYVSSMLLSLHQVTRKVQDFNAFIDTDSYVPTCPHGYCDCVYDPAYIRKHYPIGGKNSVCLPRAKIVLMEKDMMMRISKWKV